MTLWHSRSREGSSLVHLSLSLSELATCAQHMPHFSGHQPCKSLNQHSSSSAISTLPHVFGGNQCCFSLFLTVHVQWSPNGAHSPPSSSLPPTPSPTCKLFVCCASSTQRGSNLPSDCNQWKNQILFARFKPPPPLKAFSIYQFVTECVIRSE